MMHSQKNIKLFSHITGGVYTDGVGEKGAEDDILA
jgi:hypothetical protein